MKRILRYTLIGLIVCGLYYGSVFVLWAAVSSAAVQYDGTAANGLQADPQTYPDNVMGCPDPDVFRYGHGYAASCTTGTLTNAMPIYYSPDLQHWTLESYINPPANMRGGQVWADEIHYYAKAHGWVAFYAVQLPSQQMVIMESRSPNLFASNWQTRTLFQNADGHTWSIDPSVQPDPVHHGVYDMAFQQDGLLWVIGLRWGPAGFQTFGRVRLVSRATYGWEHNWEEGPVLWRVNGQEYMFMNTGNTWDGSYSIGIQQIIGSPLTGRYIKSRTPLLASSPGLEGPGIGAQPFKGPHGWLLAYHTDPAPNTYGLASRPLNFAHLLVHAPRGDHVRNLMRVLDRSVRIR